MDAQGGEGPTGETGASPSTPRSQIVPAPDAVALTDGEPGQWDLDDLQIATQHADELRRMLDDSLRDLPVGEIAEELLRDHKRVHTLVQDVETNDSATLTVANVGPVDVRANLLCVVDFQQRACTGDGDVISVDLPAWSASQPVLNIDHRESEFVFVLILIEHDRYAGVFSTSKTRLIHEPAGTDPRSIFPVVEMGDFEVGSVIPGCGVALFQDRSRLGEPPPGNRGTRHRSRGRQRTMRRRRTRLVDRTADSQSNGPRCRRLGGETVHVGTYARTGGAGPIDP